MADQSEQPLGSKAEVEAAMPGITAEVDYFNARLNLLADECCSQYTPRELHLILWPGTTFGSPQGPNKMKEFNELWNKAVRARWIAIQKLPSQFQDRARKEAGFPA